MEGSYETDKAFMINAKQLTSKEDKKMDYENQISEESCVQLLESVLTKKKGILNEILDLTKQQEIVINQEHFNEDSFNAIITKKEEQIQTLTKLDSGFDRIYGYVKEELSNNKIKYINEITHLKELITTITDLSVALQALEKRNKTRIEVIFTQKRKKLKNSRISSQTVSNYYKVMGNKNDHQSFFYDKKN